MGIVESEEVMEDAKKMAEDVEKVVGSAEALLKERTAIPNQTSSSRHGAQHGPNIYKDSETPNPKCRIFLKVDQKRYLAEGVYLSEAPIPPPSPVKHCYESTPLYLFTQGRGVGG